MGVSLTFFNDFHQWQVTKRFPPGSTSTPLFTWLGFVPLGGLDWRPWADGSIVIFCYFPSYARPCHTSYDIFWDIDPPCILVPMINYWTWIHLVHLWPWVPYILWHIFSYCANMIVTLVIHMLDLPVSLWWSFMS